MKEKEKNLGIKQMNIDRFKGREEGRKFPPFYFVRGEQGREENWIFAL